MTRNRLGDPRPDNKIKRQSLHLRAKKQKETAKRDLRLRRKREEEKNPKLRIKRQKTNVPVTIDKKRQWDEVDEAEEGATGLGLAVDVRALKRRRLDHELLDGAEGRGAKIEKEGLTEDKLEQKNPLDVQPEGQADGQAGDVKKDEEQQDDQQSSESEFADFASDAQEDGDQPDQPRLDDANEDAASDASSASDELQSILDSASDSSEPAPSKPTDPSLDPDTASQTTAPTPSTTSTHISLIPDALASKFPTLFATPTTDPKIVVTTNLSGTIHADAQLLCSLLPNAHYVPRQRHRYKSHHYSLREIAKYASNRSYTTLLVLGEDHKRPSALTAIHLPSGPTLHFSISNWVPGRSLPGHGRPTLHDPELILNNFRTPLGLLTAHFFRSLFPPSPELGGRQVVTMHNQRDYIFVRRHRYVFREKRASEKSVTDPESGEKVKGVESIKAGLQELGPRFTLKLRRIDRGIQRASGQEWEWKSRMEKERTKFQL